MRSRALGLASVLLGVAVCAAAAAAGRADTSTAPRPASATATPSADRATPADPAGCGLAGGPAGGRRAGPPCRPR
ncbi:hypothetical protein OG871_35390 [Kitasatospora sp. NBC_00374]|uniref:hypothetical protein n=1 Tax=Kitasatospora sp. NBC_00374 TaxID=2975964 RepID=UPI0030E1F9BD